jgi:DNA-binding MarR family transcriptional regulator
MSSYLKFLTATNKISSDFSDNEKQVLKGILQRDTSTPCRVQDVLEMRSVASQATLHKTLSQLVKRGYLSLKQSKEDGRVKYVAATKKTERLLDKLSTLLERSAL